MPDEYAQRHDSFLQLYQKTGVRHAMGRLRNLVGKHRSGVVFPMTLELNESKHVDDSTIYHAAISNMDTVDTVAVITCTGDGVVRSCNPNALLVFGFASLSDMLGNPVTAVLPWFSEGLANAAAKGTKQQT